MTDMTLDEAVKWLRDHVGDLRSSARMLRESPWGAKLADTVVAIYKAADKGTLAIAAFEAAREDAERYRWLRSETSPAAEVMFRPDEDFGFYALWGDELDAAVDQAREKENEND